MAISFGGDPENYMDPPQMSHSQLGDGASPFAMILDLLGIQRNVARGPKKTKGVKDSSSKLTPKVVPSAGDWIDSQGAALASQDLAGLSRPIISIDLPPSSARQSR